MINWWQSLPDAVTVCDLQGVVLEMNDRAAEIYRDYGGKALIGSNILDCHPEPARSRLLRLLETGDRNVYTTEKNGILKIICQEPWYRDSSRCGIVELAIVIPRDAPHFVR